MNINKEQRTVFALIQRAFQEVDLINRTEKASRGILTLSTLFNQAPRKVLAATVGFTFSILVWNTNSFVPVMTKFLLTPVAGTLGLSIGALVMPPSLEERRKLALDELEERINNLQDPELIEPLKRQYQALASANSNQLQQLLLPSSMPTEMKLLSDNKPRLR